MDKYKLIQQDVRRVILNEIMLCTAGLRFHILIRSRTKVAHAHIFLAKYKYREQAKQWRCILRKTGFFKNWFNCFTTVSIAKWYWLVEVKKTVNRKGREAQYVCFWWCRKLEHLEETHTSTRRTNHLTSPAGAASWQHQAAWGNIIETQVISVLNNNTVDLAVWSLG